MANLIRTENSGVEYFTVEETGESGMSQRGLARWLGIPESTLRSLLTKVQEAEVRGEKLPNSLKPFAGGGLACAVTEAQNYKRRRCNS